MWWRRGLLVITGCIGLYIVLKISVPVHLWPNYSDFNGIHSLDTELDLQPTKLLSKTSMPYSATNNLKGLQGSEAQENRRSNVYFLKLQKTGSTTMYNIFCRYAWKYNLRIPTFTKRPLRHELNKTRNIIKSITPAFIEGQSLRYNMMIEHSRFEPAEVRKVIEPPINYITMIRHPLTWLQSFLHHAKLYTKPYQLDTDNIVASFLDKLEDEAWYLSNKETVSSILNWNRNMLLFTSSQTDSNADISAIENVFFVGITDRFDESLILMKRSLGWSFRDVLYVALHKGNYNSSGVNESLYKRVCERMPFDCLMYDHFNHVLSQRILSEGKHFMEEVNYFKSTLEKINHFCSPFYDSLKYEKEIDTKVEVTFGGSEWHEPFVYTYTDCALSRFQEFTYRAMFYYRQNRYKPNLPCPLFHSKARSSLCSKIGRLSSHSDMVHDLTKDEQFYMWK